MPEGQEHLPVFPMEMEVWIGLVIVAPAFAEVSDRDERQRYVDLELWPLGCNK